MSRQKIEMVRELRADAIKASRNRNFERYDSAPGRAALRLYRLLRSLELDLQDCELLDVTADDDGVQITVRHRALSFTRTVNLDAAEFALLDDAAALAARLERALQS